MLDWFEAGQVDPSLVVANMCKHCGYLLGEHHTCADQCPHCGSMFKIGEKVSLHVKTTNPQNTTLEAWCQLCEDGYDRL